MNATPVREIAVLSVVGLLLCPALAYAQADRAFYIPFQVPGSFGTSPTAINNLCSVTGTFINITRGTHGFVRDVSGKITAFDLPESFNTYPVAINDAGAIIGTYLAKSEEYHSFLRNPDGTFTDIDVPGATGTSPTAINAFGVITGDAYTSDGSRCFVRSPQGKITMFGPPFCAATAINLFGTIVGFVSPPTPPGTPPPYETTSFVRSPAGVIRYFNAPGASRGGTYAQYLDAFGGIAGVFVDKQNYSNNFLESPQGKFTSIAPDGVRPTATNITALSDLGAATGYYYWPCPCEELPCNPCIHSFVRDVRGKLTSFDFPGAEGGPVGINVFGVIVGSSDSSGYLRVPY